MSLIDKNKVNDNEDNELENTTRKIKSEEAIIGLDKIFKKTITKPSIYYMPLTKEQVVL